MSNNRYDVIVVGSGAAGSIAVKELTERGLDVLLLEAGRNITLEEFNTSSSEYHGKGIDVLSRFRAAFRGQQMQARYMSFDEQYRNFFVNDRENPYSFPSNNQFLWIRGRQLGGRLHTYGRVLLRMTDLDFKAASYDGFGENWPITYQDISPYYDKVEEFLGVYGTEEHIPHLPDGKYIKTPSLNSFEQDFKHRIEANWPERHVIPWRYAAPNLKRIPLGILSSLETGHLNLITDAIVNKVNIDKSTGKASGVTYIDRVTKKTEKVEASAVLVCASTIESIRLLLNSACSEYPEGLGNSSGLLGRYFMDHCPAVIFGSIENRKGWEYDNSVPQDPFLPIAGGIYIPRFENLNKQTNRNFARGFAFQGTIGGIYVPDNHNSKFAIMGFGEMLPNYDNYVTIDKNKKDAHGIPVPFIKCSYTQNEYKLMKEQLRVLREIADICQYKVEFAGDSTGLDIKSKPFPESDPLSRFIFKKSFKKSLSAGAAIHEVGGIRMGNDPAKSILNPYNQCWDIKNLFVTDGSCFVSTGIVGPALTIMALTARACEYLAKQYKKGNL